MAMEQLSDNDSVTMQKGLYKALVSLIWRHVSVQETKAASTEMELTEDFIALTDSLFTQTFIGVTYKLQCLYGYIVSD